MKKYFLAGPVLFFLCLIAVTVHAVEPQLSSDVTVSGPSSHVLPLKLSLTPRKPRFVVGEKITFELALTNVGPLALKVYNLDEQSVSCDINGKRWGSKTASGDMPAILLPGNVLRKNFKISGVSNPGKFTASCSYVIGVKDLYPSADMQVDVVR